jgi:hypothetical protein
MGDVKSRSKIGYFYEKRCQLLKLGLHIVGHFGKMGN